MRNKIRWVLLLVIPVIIFWLISEALWMRNPEVSVTSNGSTANVLTEVMNAQKEGGLVLFDSSELNELLQTYFKDGVSCKNFSIKGINVDINKGYITLEAPVNYKFINFALTTRGGIYLSSDGSGGKIIFRPDSFSIGRLPLAPKLMYSLINKESFGGFGFENNRIVVDTSKLPVKISDAGLKNDRLYIYVEKNSENKIDSAGKIPSNNAAPKAAENVKGEPQKPKENASPSSKNVKQNSSKTESGNINNRSKEDLLALDNQLENAKASLSTASEKKIVTMLQSTIQKLISNSSYNYTKDEASVRAMYSRLTSSQKAAFKSVILSNVNSSTVVELMNIFMK